MKNLHCLLLILIFFTKNISAQVITSTNPVICGTNTSATLSASPTGTYQWSFCATEFGTYANISGATSSTYTTTSLGFYKVLVNSTLSPAFRVRQGGTATLVSTSPTAISAGQSTTLSMTFTGSGPWYYTVSSTDGVYKKDFSSNNPSATLSVLPLRSSYYQISTLYDANGIGCTTGLPSVTVNPTASFTLPTPTITSACAGSILDIPITYSGTWGSAGSIPNSIYIRTKLTTTAGVTVNGTEQYWMNGSTLKYVIPPGTATGQYKISAIAEYPSTGTVLSSYNISVVNTGCSVIKPIINMYSNGCDANLYANPQGSGYTYQWYKDGVAIPNSNFYIYTVKRTSENGNYTVAVTNSSINYNSTSDAKTVLVGGSATSVTRNGSNLCGQVSLSSNYTGSGFTYQWYRSDFVSVNSRIPLVGETNPTINVTQQGNYMVKVWDGSCQSESDVPAVFDCPPQITSINPIICGANTQATLTTSATGTYQWSYSSSQFGTYANISGATTNTHITSTIGFYKVTVNGIVSNPFSVASSSYAIVNNASGNTNPIQIAASGGNADLHISFYGAPPFTATLSNDNISTTITSSTNLKIINVAPETSRFYNVNSVQGSCGSSGNGSSILVNVGPNPVLAYATPTMTTVCPGGVITIPYTLTGNGGTNRNLYAQLYTSGGTYVNNSFIGNFSSNPIYYQIPTTTAAGTYKFAIGGNLPYISGTGLSPYTFDVVTTGCPTIPQAVIQSYVNSCSNISMSAIPSGSGYAFQWYKDNLLISGATSSNYTASLSGAYKVVVTNTTTSYNSTSADKNLTIAPKPILTSPNPVICGSNTSATISTASTGAGYTYQWKKYNTTTFVYDNLSGQTSSSITVTAAGTYRLEMFDGSCTVTSDNFVVSTTSSGVLKNSSGNNNAVNLNPGQTENLQLTLSGVGPWTYTLYGGVSSVTSTTSTSPVTIPVSPEVSRNYSVGLNSSGCGSGNVSGSVTVNISPNPSFTFGTVATTACPGGFLEVPTTRVGNWGVSGFEKVGVTLYTSAGAYVSYIGEYSSPTMLVAIPSSVTVGNAYKLYISPSTPYMSGSYTPNFTITSTCPAPPNAVIEEQNSICSPPTLKALPSGSGYTFQWKKAGVDIVGATSQTYSPTQSDNYSVVIQNTSLSYNSTSPTKAITVNATTPTLSCPNTILCSPNTSTTITSNYTGVGFTYSWRKDYVVIAGATGSSITVTDAGQYDVTIVNNIGCTSSSTQLRISYSGNGTLLNSSDNNNAVYMVSPQTTENLKVNLTGTGPWEIGLNDGNTLRTYTANATPFIIPVSPTSLTVYSIGYVASSCGINRNNVGSVSVGIAPTPTMTFPTPSNLTICRGNIIDVPYTVTGNVGNKLQIGILLGDPTGGESRDVYTYQNVILEPFQTSGTIPVYIPTDIALGSYAILFFANSPFFRLSPTYDGAWTSYAINVVNTSCPAQSAPTISGLSSGCESVFLSATPFTGFGGAGSNTYQWFKNGVAMTGKTSSSLTVYESGNYTVQVINGAYNQTSAAKTVTINRIIPTITSTNAVLCTGNTSATLTTSFTGSGYTHQWYKDVTFSNGSVEQIPLFGETASSLTVSTIGGYSIRTWDGSCLQNSKSSSVDVTGSLVPTPAFAVTSCVASAPEINLKGNNVSIISGDITPSTTDHTDFGSVYMASTPIVRTFTIENLGTANLTLSGSPLVSITGTNASDFTLTTLPTSPVVASGSTTFQITFNPSGASVRSATLSIANNDSDENPYTFAIQGTGISCTLNTSQSSGNWGTAGVWSCGHVPLVTEPVQISSGHTITLDVNGTAKSLDLRGILNKQATKILLIQGN